MTFLFRYDGVPEFRASPGLDSIFWSVWYLSPPRLFFLLLLSLLVCGVWDVRGTNQGLRWRYYRQARRRSKEVVR